MAKAKSAAGRKAGRTSSGQLDLLGPAPAASRAVDRKVGAPPPKVVGGKPGKAQKASKTQKAPPKKAPAPAAKPSRRARAEPKPARSRARGKVQAPPLPVEPPQAFTEAAEAEQPPRAPKPKRRATAEQMATRQREISVSEFFSKNRHLLGFDSPTKALLTTVKEAVDNSLDACEEAGILPDITVEIREVPGAGDRYVVGVEDNGPGIVKAQVPKIFGKLLYGSKFHRLKQSRGQQGIGISAAAMYGQITTGKPVQVWTKTGRGRPGHRLDVQIDTRKNVPVVVADDEIKLEKDHGTRVEIEMQADYGRGQRYLLRYVEQTVLANPHLALTYKRPNAEPIHFPRAAEEPPKEALEIKPHPYGVEVGTLMLMAKESKHRDVRSFLQNEFSRVSALVADEILRNAGLRLKLRTGELAEDREVAEKLRKGILETKIMAPPTNCLSPIGDELIRKGLISFLSVVEDEAEEMPDLDLFEGKGKRGRGRKKLKEKSAEERQAEIEKAAADAAPPEPGEELIKGKKFFIVSTTRPPKVYRGNPFQVEVGLAWGGDWPQDKQIELYRFANRVPLLFQRGACGVTDGVVKTDWKKYELQQPRGGLPVGPMALLVHIASVWVPFTSESKEAIAHYPELLAEIRLALQECGRKLAAFLRKRKAAAYELKRRSIFELYIEEVARSLHELTGADRETVKAQLLEMARDVTGGEETDEILDRVAKGGKRRDDDEDGEVMEEER
ncbi:DNA topoisomerase VI subunit B [Vulgatibacter sp.]|uniref:DNA topoisomerase VI subunit B n=1 Tax=Vulgatibacter sp. TaxID=1971226 RepID=UPI003569DE6F